MLVRDQLSDFSVQGTISSLSRAIWYNNARLAKKIILRSDFAEKHVHVVDGVVQLISPQLYEAEVAELKHAFLSKQSQTLHQQSQAPFIKQAQRKKLDSKKAAAQRWLKLWLPTSKRLVLHGLKIDNGDGTQTVRA